jgi:hypothetical protein
MTQKHKHAELLRMAADNADQLFECDEAHGKMTIASVIAYPHYNWRPVKPKPKKIKRWLWATPDGFVTNRMYPIEDDERLINEGKTKLLWSETEFEVNDD